MQIMNRRNFCSASLLALPAMKAFAGKKGIDALSGNEDPVLHSLADELTRTTFDGARGGFRAAHFRRYAGQVRVFNAYLETNGTNRRLNRKLGADDYYLLDPDHTVRTVTGYWKKHGILLDENSLEDLVVVDERSYISVKKAIKKQGGIRKFHERIARAFDRKAEEHESLDYQSGLKFHDGSLRFPALADSRCRNFFRNVQFTDDLMMDPDFLANLDCLCKAMSVEAAMLSVLCATICPPCCVPAAIIALIVLLLESFEYCDPSDC